MIARTKCEPFHKNHTKGQFRIIFCEQITVFTSAFPLQCSHCDHESSCCCKFTGMLQDIAPTAAKSCGRKLRGFPKALLTTTPLVCSGLLSLLFLSPVERGFCCTGSKYLRHSERRSLMLPILTPSIFPALSAAAALCFLPCLKKQHTLPSHLSSQVLSPLQLTGHNELLILRFSSYSVTPLIFLCC